MDAIIAAHPDDPRRALTELATALTRDDFAAVQRGCPFINASAEFSRDHIPRGRTPRRSGDWVTRRLEGLLHRLEHRDPRATAEQLMMVRTGAVVSRALDENDHLNQDFLTCWNKLIDDGLPRAQ